MKSNNNIEEEVSKTLNSLEEISEVKVKPYFYTRLMARIENEDTQSGALWNWGYAAIVLIVLINVVSLMNISNDTVETVDVIDLMASEYSLKNEDIYNTTLE